MRLAAILLASALLLLAIKQATHWTDRVRYVERNTATAAIEHNRLVAEHNRLVAEHNRLVALAGDPRVDACDARTEHLRHVLDLLMRTGNWGRRVALPQLDGWPAWPVLLKAHEVEALPTDQPFPRQDQQP